MALVGEPIQPSQRQSSTMEPPRVERASHLASEYSLLVGGGDGSSSPAVAVDSPDRFSGSPNRQKEMDLVAAAALKSEEYRQLFRLPPGEVLVQDFNCALQENILFQGHLYVFRSYICFYSNIFGFETKKIIPFSEITLLRRAKTAGIFPNAIEVFTEEKKHFFASFLSRDEAFNLLSDLWPDSENSVKGSSQLEDSPSVSGSRSCETLAISNIYSSGNGADDLDSLARIQNVPFTNDSGSISIAEDRNGQVSPLQENVAAPVTNTFTLTPAKDMVLKQEDIEAPSVPADFVKVAEATFPIRVDDFFRFFFSDEGVSFVESFHKQCGDTDFKCTEWCPSDKFGHVREVSFLHPIKIYLGAKSGSCRETQKFRLYKNNHLIVETSQEVNGVPYADYFTVEGIWDVESDESGEACVMKVYLDVAFSKRTVWKGKIVQSTLEECREAYAIWINIAHELLKKKNLENQDILVCSVQKAEIGESSRMLSQANEHLRQPLSSSIDADKPIDSTKNEPFPSSTLFSGKIIKMFGAMRNQGYLPHLLFVTVAVVLLMQLTIVVLLSRPPHVQPVYQMDYFNGMNQGLRLSPQELAWVEKRILHLKEEMLMVESRLERMRLEHKSLKSQLEDFEHFSIKD